MKPKNKKLSKVSIKTKVFGYFAIFIAITIGFIWTFQVLLLDDFYKATKIKEIHRSGEAIERALNSDNADEVLRDLAYHNQICVEVINLDTLAHVSVETTHNCVIHKLPYASLANYAELASENGGTYTELLATMPAKNQFFHIFTDDEESSLIYAHITTINESQILIMLNSSISPVDATVDTIKYQIKVLSFILIVMATILGYIMYRKISKPIMQMNESAKELAKGNYETEFNGTGYLEIQELSNTLTYAEHELSKVDSLRQELIANISHDLRTPLTMISGYAEVMRDLPDENNAENAQVIIDEAARLTSLVNDVLDLSKLQSGSQVLELETYCLTTSIKEMLGRYQKFVSNDGYTINFEYDEEVYITADELRISQVVYNLINNALTYTGDDKMVIIRQKVINNRVRIEVIDHGVGISEEQMDNIWDRYYKANNQHRRAVNGTGLGLSIVKTTLAAHNELKPNVASYGVESVLNEGSTFYFEYEITKENA